MRKECGSIVEPISKTPIVKTLFGEIVSKISLKAFAEETEGDNSDENGGEESKSTPTINYEDLIAKARKEEKEKQYKTIEKLKGQVDTLTKQHNDDLIAKADLEKKLEEAYHDHSISQHRGTKRLPGAALLSGHCLSAFASRNP